MNSIDKCIQFYKDHEFLVLSAIAVAMSAAIIILVKRKKMQRNVMPVREIIEINDILQNPITISVPSEKELAKVPIIPNSGHKRPVEIKVECLNENEETTQKLLDQVTKKVVKVKEKKEKLQTIYMPTDLGTGQIRIGYKPNEKYNQNGLSSYPITKFPMEDCLIQLPRKFKRQQRGFTETKFQAQLDNYFSDQFAVLNNRSLATSKRPYEPDITLIRIEESINLYIDIEIDEPYSGETRKPLHCLKDDKNRDDFFSSVGWITIRFSEKQIALESIECLAHIANVIKSVYNDFKIPEILGKAKSLTRDDKWDKDQAKKWALEKYREKYLGIRAFVTETEIIAGESIELSEQEKEIQRQNEALILISETEEKEKIPVNNVNNIENENFKSKTVEDTKKKDLVTPKNKTSTPKAKEIQIEIKDVKSEPKEQTDKPNNSKLHPIGITFDTEKNKFVVYQDPQNVVKINFEEVRPNFSTLNFGDIIEITGIQILKIMPCSDEYKKNAFTYFGKEFDIDSDLKAKLSTQIFSAVTLEVILETHEQKDYKKLKLIHWDLLPKELSTLKLPNQPQNITFQPNYSI